MYNWRHLSDTERAELVAYRKARLHPWHSVPHCDGGNQAYLFTAACYEHRPIIGTHAARMRDFEKALLDTIAAHSEEIMAWCVLPNHYHAVARTTAVRGALAAIGDLHGRTSHDWNGDDNMRGRKVWCGCPETVMKSPRHLLATINYVHNNPVHHHYASRWQDWPYSSARDYLEQVGRDEAARMWKEYPIDRYGESWDAPEF